MKAEEIAQWVIDNRYSKSEKQKISDAEMYRFIVNVINKLNISTALFFKNKPVCNHIFDDFDGFSKCIYCGISDPNEE